jgi:hypothetical protein
VLQNVGDAGAVAHGRAEHGAEGLVLVAVEHGDELGAWARRAGAARAAGGGRGVSATWVRRRRVRRPPPLHQAGRSAACNAHMHSHCGLSACNQTLCPAAGNSTRAARGAPGGWRDRARMPGAGRSPVFSCTYCRTQESYSFTNFSRASLKPCASCRHEQGRSPLLARRPRAHPTQHPHACPCGSCSCCCAAATRVLVPLLTSWPEQRISDMTVGAGGRAGTPQRGPRQPKAPEGGWLVAAARAPPPGRRLPGGAGLTPQQPPLPWCARWTGGWRASSA